MQNTTANTFSRKSILNSNLHRL